MGNERVYNFSAGPSMLPLEVLERAGKEITRLSGLGYVRHGDEPPLQGFSENL